MSFKEGGGGGGGEGGAENVARSSDYNIYLQPEEEEVRGGEG